MSADQQTIARGFADLRRGEAVVVRCGDGTACLVKAAEQIEAHTCRGLAELAGSTPSLIISHHRGRAIGLAPKPDVVAVSIALPPSITSHALGGLIGDHDQIPSLNSLSVLPEKPDSLAETALTLMRLARLLPAVLVARVQGKTDLRHWADSHGMLILNETAIREFEAVSAATLREVASAPLPLADAESARIVLFRPSDGGGEHFAVLIGEATKAVPPVVRIHSQCITGDVLGSLRCDCGDQLRLAIRRMAELGGGVVVYLAQEGRDIGLVNKLKAYALQDKGMDTVDANHMLGFEADHRHFLPAAEILRQLGISEVKLLTNNPDKIAQLEACGIKVVARLPLVVADNPHNRKYLATKQQRSGHFIG